MMRYPRACAIGSCLISLGYPICALVFRDAVVAFVFFGALLRGVYRYLFCLPVFVRAQMPCDAFSFLFRRCCGRISPVALVTAVGAALLFALLALLPMRILLDFSMAYAKAALFIPFLYCAAIAVVFFKRNSKKR